jgi:hypothetical protein
MAVVAAARIASLSVGAIPPTVKSRPPEFVDDCHHQGRAGSLGAHRRPIMIRVSDS